MPPETDVRVLRPILREEFLRNPYPLTEDSWITVPVQFLLLRLASLHRPLIRWFRICCKIRGFPVQCSVTPRFLHGPSEVSRVWRRW